MHFFGSGVILPDRLIIAAYMSDPLGRQISSLINFVLKQSSEMHHQCKRVRNKIIDFTFCNKLLSSVCYRIPPPQDYKINERTHLFKMFAVYSANYTDIVHHIGA